MTARVHLLHRAQLWFLLAGGPQDLKVDVRLDSGICDSGVELSTA